MIEFARDNGLIPRELVGYLVDLFSRVLHNYHDMH